MFLELKQELNVKLFQKLRYSDTCNHVKSCTKYGRPKQKTKNQQTKNLSYLGYLKYKLCGHFDKTNIGVHPSGRYQVSRQRWRPWGMENLKMIKREINETNGITKLIQQY